MKEYYFTVMSSNYIRYAKALNVSIGESVEGVSFFVLLIDRPTDFCAKEFEMDCFFLEDYVDENWFRQASFFYTAFELCNAARPVGHRIARDVIGADRWVYLDADLHIRQDFRRVWSDYPNASVILTPHSTVPNQSSTSHAFDRSYLNLGSFNSGMMFCRRTEKTDQFLAWFESKLQYNCFNQWRSCFVDQKWLDLAFQYEWDIEACRTPGVNVGYWNIEERNIRELNGRVYVDDVELSVFHFSMWKESEPDLLNGAAVKCSDVAWAVLRDDYIKLLCGVVWRGESKSDYRYNKTRSGASVLPSIRRQYFLDYVCNDYSADPWCFTRLRLVSIGFKYFACEFFAASKKVVVGCINLIRK